MRTKPWCVYILNEALGYLKVYTKSQFFVVLRSYILYLISRLSSKQHPPPPLVPLLVLYSLFLLVFPPSCLMPMPAQVPRRLPRHGSRRDHSHCDVAPLSRTQMVIYFGKFLVLCFLFHSLKCFIVNKGHAKCVRAPPFSCVRGCRLLWT